MGSYCQIDRILLIRLRSIGDTLLFTPAIRAVREAFPAAFLAALVEEDTAPILLNNPHLDQILISNEFDCLEISKLRKTIHNLFFLGQLKAFKFDLVINFHGGPRSAIMTLATAARYRVGLPNYQFSFFYNAFGPHPDLQIQTQGKLHTIKQQLSLLNALDIKINSTNLELSVSGLDRLFMASNRDLNFAPSGGVKIIIQPGVSRAVKFWGEQRFACLIDNLKDHIDCQIILTGSAKDKSLLGKIENLCQSKVKNLAGCLTLGQLMALMEKADLYLGGDSGPSHIAAALGLPGVVLFGGSDVDIWSPNSDRIKVLSAQLDCSPCSNKCRYESYRCLDMISVEQVVKEVFELVKTLKL